MYRKHLTIETRGRGTHEITSQVQHVVERSGVVRGLCSLFIHHTSASLIVCENADPTVRRDLEHSPRGWCRTAIPRSATTARARTTCRPTSDRS